MYSVYSQMDNVHLDVNLLSLESYSNGIFSVGSSEWSSS